MTTAELEIRVTEIVYPIAERFATEQEFWISGNDGLQGRLPNDVWSAKEWPTP